MGRFDDYRSSPMPPERRPGEPYDKGNSPVVTSRYDDLRRVYTFADGIEVSDEELEASREPLIRLYYEKQAERARAQQAKMEEALFPPAYRADLQRQYYGVDRSVAVKAPPVDWPATSLTNAPAGWAEQMEKARSTKLTPEVVEAMRARLSDAGKAERRLINQQLAELGTKIAEKIFPPAPTDEGRAGIHYLGLFGHVMALASEYNYGGATRGWMLEMD